MSTNHLAMRPSTRLIVTLLATLSIIAAQFAMLALQPPAVAAPHVYDVTLQFSDNGVVDTVVLTDVQSDTGNDIPVPGYDWDEQSSGLFHVSCSADPLVGTTATVTGTGTPWPIGTQVTITYADIERTNVPGGNCTEGTFRDPTVSLTIDKEQVDNRGEDATNETFTFSVACDDGTEETGIEITGTGTYTVTGIAEDADCTVTETDTADADLTEAGTDPNDLTETDTLEDVDVGTEGATVYFVNTYDAPDPATIQLELAKLWLDEDGEPTDARPSSDWNITLTDDEDETNSISVPPSFDGQTGIDLATENITLEVGTGYTVTESGVNDGWSEVTCTADEIAYINESFGFDIVVSTHGTDSFTAEEDQNWTAHLVCNQQDDDPPPPPTPTPTPDPGEVTVEKVVLGEDAPEDAEFSFILECGDTTEEFTLADGESSDTFTVAAGTDCTVSETDDQDANLTSWELTGDAVDSGEGSDADGFTVAANDEITVTFTNEFADVMAEVLEPGISVTKTAVDGVSEDDEGNLTVTIEGEGGSATVTYEFVVTNTGDDDLTDLTLVDDKIGDLTDALTAELEDATLPVGESVTVTADHEVTAADFDGITLTNVVEVVGVGVDSGATVDDSDDETVTLIEVMDVVEEEPEELPKTGLSSAGLTGLGLLLSMIGAAALLLTSPRREEDAS